MNKDEKQLEAEVKEWIVKLFAASGKEKQQAASELTRLGIWSRSSVRTRGSLTSAADNRLPEPAKLSEMIECLHDADKDVRCQVALTLGEWGGQEAAKALSELLKAETDEDVQLYCVTALQTIGGIEATEGLCHAVIDGSDAVRSAAITAVEELITGGRIEDTEAAPPPRLESKRGKPSVRTRGAAEQASEDKKIGGLMKALALVRDDDQAKKYLRLQAGDVLGYLED